MKPTKTKTYPVPRNWKKPLPKLDEDVSLSKWRRQMKAYASLIAGPPGVGKSAIADTSIRKMNRRRKRKNRIRSIRLKPYLEDPCVVTGYPHPT